MKKCQPRLMSFPTLCWRSLLFTRLILFAEDVVSGKGGFRLGENNFRLDIMDFFNLFFLL